MRKFIMGAAALVGLMASSSNAFAQHNRNVIRNSGNGVGNTIVARNVGYPQPQEDCKVVCSL